MFKSIKNLFKKSADKYTLYKSINLQGDTVINSKKSLDINEISLYINRGLAKRADKVGQIQFKAYKVSEKGKEPVELPENHWLNKLLDRPNPKMTGDTFWKLATLYRDCGGALILKKTNEAVFQENQQITELELLNPAGMQIKYENNEVKSYEVSDFVTGEKKTYLANQVIYWRIPNPKKPTEGVSLLQSAGYSIDLDNQLSIYQTAVLRNGGSVDAVFSFENLLNKEQLDVLKSSYGEEYAEAKNAKRPLFLGGDAKFERVGLTPDEIGFIQGKELTINDLAVATGVPKSILGLTSGDTFANADIAYRIFLRETIKPLADELVNLLDWQLAPKDLEISYIDPTPEDVEQKLKTLETASRVGAITLNEKRDMLGLEPVKNGDEVEKPVNTQPAKEEVKSVKPLFVHPLKNKEHREKYLLYHQKSLKQREKRFNTELDKYLTGQKNRVLGRLGSSKTKAVKMNTNEIFDEELEIKLAMPLLETIKQIAKEAGQDIYEMFNTGHNFVYSSSLESALSNRFDFWARKVNETTAGQLTDRLQAWTSSGESLNELVDSIKELFSNIREGRARTIANTEIGIATQQAKLDGYKQLGIATKVWVWSPGIKGGVRDGHQALDGEEVPTNGYFSNGMRSPQDPNFGADEICNCECSL